MFKIGHIEGRDLNTVLLLRTEGWTYIASHHNRPLYVIASVREVELRRALIDLGSPLNIMSLSARDSRDSSRQNHRASN